jgi:membrane-bound lytic murein transglycosylase D
LRIILTPLKKKNPYILVILLLLSLVAGFCIHAVVDPKDSDRDYTIAYMKNSRVFTPDLPASADFAGEKAPLNNILVRESLDREIMAGTFMHSSTILMFKRAHRWFPVIEPILKQNNIPDDFKYLAVAESNISNVVSPSHAEGFWQFLKPTGQKYGLEITEEVDERYNLEKVVTPDPRVELTKDFIIYLYFFGK